jgi:hypothetical protein
LAWWWNERGYPELDHVLLGEDGEAIGKGRCCASFCTHVRLVRDGELPAPPADGKMRA